MKHSLELTQLVVNTGGIGALMETLYQNKDDDSTTKVGVVTALGYISGKKRRNVAKLTFRKGSNEV